MRQPYLPFLRQYMGTTNTIAEPFTSLRCYNRLDPAITRITAGDTRLTGRQDRALSQRAHP